MSEAKQRKRTAPENWAFIGKPEYPGIGGSRYQNDCGLWLVIEGDKVVTWVGNFHVAVRGTKKEIGRFGSEEAAEEAAREWMEENPDPWGSSSSRSDSKEEP